MQRPDKDTQPAVRQQIERIIADVLHAHLDETWSSCCFTELGMDSVLATEIAGHLAVILGVHVGPMVAFDYPTVDELEKYISGQLAGQRLSEPEIGRPRLRPSLPVRLAIESA
jgi:acyl carrier protein